MNAVDIIKAGGERVTFVTSDAPPIELQPLPEAPATGRHWQQPAPIRSVEADHPWLWWLYVAAVLAAIALSAIWPLGFAS